MDGTNLRSFEQEWPGLAARLDRALASKGVPPWQRDDAVQEVGLKLLRIWDEVDPQRSPFGLALTMAKNSLWDQTHRGSGRELVGEVPERTAPHDVEEIGLARLEVTRVGHLLKQLSAEHRSVLLAEVGGMAATARAASPAATKMLRLRARRRLGALMEQTPIAITTPALGLRDLARRVSDALRRNQWLTEVPGAAAAGVIAVAVAMTMPGSADSRLDSVGQRRLLPVALTAGTEPAAVERGPALEEQLRDLSDRKTRQGRRLADTTTRESTHYEVVVGEGTPAESEVSVDIVPEENGNYLDNPPECRHAASDEGLELSCSAKTQTRTVRTKVRVKMKVSQ